MLCWKFKASRAISSVKIKAGEVPLDLYYDAKLKTICSSKLKPQWLYPRVPDIPVIPMKYIGSASSAWYYIEENIFKLIIAGIEPETSKSRFGPELCCVAMQVSKVKPCCAPVVVNSSNATKLCTIFQSFFKPLDLLHIGSCRMYSMNL